MSEIIRDANVIAGEINAIKQEVRDTAIRGAIEIGKRLLEAKSLVPYGSWGKWLEENVDYSERTAQDLMRIANEYGRKETQALAEIQNTTQAVLLLALDSGERERFVQEHDMAKISTRDLEAEIAELKKEREKAQLTIEELFKEVERLQEPVPGEGDLEQEKIRADELEKSLEEASRRTAEAEKRHISDLHAEQEKTKKVSDEVKRLRDELAEARKQAAAKEKQLKRTEEELTEARQKVQTVEVVPETVEQELKRLRAQAARSACESEVRAAYDVYKAGFDRLMDKLEKTQLDEADVAEKYRSVFYKATITMAERLRGK